MSASIASNGSEDRPDRLVADSAARPALRIQGPASAASIIHRTSEGSGNHGAQYENAAQHADRQQYVGELLHAAN